MARTRASVLFVAVLLVVSGCKAFFDFNAFSSLDKASVPNPSRYQGASGLANLQADLQSQSIVNALKGDLGTVATILSNLNTSYAVTTGPLSTPDAQTAAILYSDLSLQSTSGDVLVNNIVGTLMTNPQGNLQAMLQSIVPPDVAADLTKFTNMVNGLLAAKVVYQVLGGSITDVNGNGKIDPGEGVPPGTNMGDTAQKAAVSYLMLTIFNAVTPFDTGTEIAAMFALLNNQANNISTLNVADPFTPMSGVPWLKNIFDCAGAPYPA